MDKMNDNTIMPFGQHKGKKMIDVPDHYLKWFWSENEYQFLHGELSFSARNVMAYIQDSFDEKELK